MIRQKHGENPEWKKAWAVPLSGSAFFHWANFTADF
jgi:hypothetical protein